MQFRESRHTEANENAEIRVADIVKEYGKAAALRGVSLDVHAGELMALLGPSGSGKTTLLRVIAGLEIPERGQVLFGGRDATALPVQERQIGFVFQHYALFKHLSVFDNIAYGLRARPRAHRPSAGEIRRRVVELLELVQLKDMERRFPAQLSGGQRQRVALARALAVEPRVLLLDEPFGALDARVRKDLRRWLRGIHEKTGRTTLFVTHDQDEALELADRVAILNNGRIEQIGTPDEVQDQPASAFVATFIGDATRIPARVQNGEVWIAERQVQVELLEAAKRPCNGSVDLYCRPWHLHLVEADAAPLTGVVIGVRRVGRGRHVEVRVAPDLSIEVEAPPHATFAVGQQVGIVVDGAHAFPTGA